MGSTLISEKLYRCLVSTILNSTPDARVGCQQKDLLAHIRQVFDFHQYLHEDIVEEESQNKPEFELHIQSLEVRDVNWTSHCSPYCVLSISKKGDDSLRSITPPGSPHVRRKITVSPVTPPLPENVVPQAEQYTSCLLERSHNTPAQWHEEFHFALGDDRRQLLRIIVYKTELQNDSLKSPNSGSTSNLSRSPNVLRKSTLFVLNALTKTPSSTSCRDTAEELIGVSVLPLKQLPVNQWCEKLIPFCKRKAPIVDFRGGGWQNGSVRLKLRLSTKHRSMPNELPEADCFVTLYEVADIVRQFHLSNASRQTENYDRCATYSGELPDCSDAVLDQFTTANHFPRLTKNIINLGVLLEWSINGGPLPLHDQTLSTALDYLRVNILSSPHPSTIDCSRVLNFSLSTLENELNIYLSELSSKFLEHYLKMLPNRTSFFPPSGDGGLLTFKKSLNKFCWELCQLELWMWTDEKPIQTLQRQIKLFVEEDTKTWFAKNFGNLVSGNSREFLQEVDTLTDLLTRLYDSYRYHLTSAHTFFKNFEVDYLALTFPIIDAQITAALEAELNTFKRYQQNFFSTINCIQSGTKASSKLYFASKNFIELVSGYCDISKSSMQNYQQWFSECIHLWLYTSKTLSMDFVLKAVKSDTELKKAADDVNFTASAVHVLSVCKEICSDFMKLQLTDPDVLSISIVKLADIVCDNILGYARYLFRYVTNRFSMITKVKLMRAANSIAHVGLYMYDKLPEFLAFENVYACLKTKRGKNCQEYLQLKETLEKLMASTKEITDALSNDVVVAIIRHFRSEIEKHCKIITAKREEKSGNFTAYMKQIFVDEKVGSLILFLEKALHGLRGSLLPELFSCAFDEIWRTTISTVRNGMHRGQCPLYYEEIYNYMKGLEEFFNYHDSHGRGLTEYNEFMRDVELQSRTTSDIILNYYACLADVHLHNNNDNSGGTRGLLRLKFGYERIIGEKINVLVKLIEFDQIQVTTGEHRRNTTTSVTVGLCPESFFPKKDYPVKRTQINIDHFNPQFNETFQFIVPQVYPLGTVLCFSLIATDLFPKQEILIGQTFVHLSHVPLLQWNQDINEMEVTELQMQPVAESPCSCFQILKERQCADKVAKQFVNEQMLMIYYRTVSSNLPDEPTCTNALHLRLKEFIVKSHEKFSTVLSSNSIS